MQPLDVCYPAKSRLSGRYMLYVIFGGLIDCPAFFSVLLITFFFSVFEVDYCRNIFLGDQINIRKYRCYQELSH